MGDRHAPGPFIRHAALVEGYPASVLDRLLEQAVQHGVLRNLPESRQALVLDTVAAIAEAAEAWRTHIDAVHAVTADGNAATGAMPTVPPSGREPIGTEEAAEMLRLQPRQVRNLAPTLGVKVAGRWLFDRDAVAAEAARRSETS